ncbi:aliphatic sulfonate ABC transporter substrate-binding protein [Xylophilus sp.]|uniref:aliphatic sulfonate ABC transporter substrate-binding protein n=1 Tax=Xylophilus sp. TaxID=2653893 RepID=UPI0013B9EC25|nr:aliphatic sulfonate ABC transporter substrate-binding protein [Xylophilus sp.]KAF1046291.1 MAG: putative aliphatic sulfonates-binding protein [Xylophilus sp.]
MSTRRHFMGRSAAAALACAAPWAVHAAPQKTLRIGYQKFNTINLLKGTGRLEKALAPLGVAVKWAEFPSAPATYEALNTGNIDIAHAADTNTVFAQSSGIRFAYLAVEVPNPKGLAILARKDSSIRDIADLRGKTFVTGRGWTPQYLALRALEEKGLSYDDIKPAYVSVVADARLAFESGRADAVGLWEPFLAAAELSGDVHVLRDAQRLAANRTVYVGNPDYAASQAEVLTVFFGELQQTQQWAQQHPEEVAARFAPQLGVDEKILLRASQRRNYGVERITPQVIAEQQKVADAFHTLKLIPKPVAVSEARFADASRFLRAI